MQNLCRILSASLLFGAVAACDGPQEENISCDLSDVSIKSVSIKGDDDGHISRFIKRELYSFGAKQDGAGVELIGTITGHEDSYNFSVETENGGMASAQRYQVSRLSHWSANDIPYFIGKNTARDFCRIHAHVPQKAPPKAE